MGESECRSHREFAKARRRRSLLRPATSQLKKPFVAFKQRYKRTNVRCQCISGDGGIGRRKQRPCRGKALSRRGVSNSMNKTKNRGKGKGKVKGLE